MFCSLTPLKATNTPLTTHSVTGFSHGDQVTQRALKSVSINCRSSGCPLEVFLVMMVRRAFQGRRGRHGEEFKNVTDIL